MIEYRRLSEMDANDILTRTTHDEVPEGFREEVWVEEDEMGDVVENWFVGTSGAISMSGEEISNEKFQLKITQDGN